MGRGSDHDRAFLSKFLRIGSLTKSLQKLSSWDTRPNPVQRLIDVQLNRSFYQVLPVAQIVIGRRASWRWRTRPLDTPARCDDFPVIWEIFPATHLKIPCSAVQRICVQADLAISSVDVRFPDKNGLRFVRTHAYLSCTCESVNFGITVAVSVGK